ncbi:MAG: hypothetical protein FWC79_00175 [Oscillospiraceae bacterium]|nr:hypothetical protein [Oscillospiraceae bacterium]
MHEEKITFDELLSDFDKVAQKESKYKKEKMLTRRNDGFAYGSYTTSIGNVAVECSDTLKVLEYYILAIKTRNTITISDVEFDEMNLKSMLLVIFCEALDKFGVNKNLIMLIPYEECHYDKFDKVIYPEEHKVRFLKEQTDKIYLYLENIELKQEVALEKEKLRFKDIVVLEGDFNTVVRKINKTRNLGVAIYTKDKNLAHKFINLIHSENAYVNATLQGVRETEYVDELHAKKNIMYPLQAIEKEAQGEEGEERKDLQMVVLDTNLWYEKISNKVKKLVK